MNYLTNYYKNLCEQLQEKINILEARIRSPAEMRALGAAEMARELEPVEGNAPPRINAGYSPWAARATRREDMINRASAQLGPAAEAGDVPTARAIGDVLADTNKPEGSGKEAGLRNWSEEPDEDDGEPVKSARQYRLEQETKEREALLAARRAGQAVAVPSDIAAMRAFISAARRGGYSSQPPAAPPHSSNATY